MIFNRLTYLFILTLTMFIVPVGNVSAQTEQTNVPKAQKHREAEVDSLGNRPLQLDSLTVAQADATVDSLLVDTVTLHRMGLTADTVTMAKPIVKERWIPNPKRALWMAIVFPGGGQIYNRKYWKLPLIYGGFIGCIYALTWNGSMYSDYSQAYIDIMDSDPNTKSYMNFIPSTYDVNANIDRLKEIFRRKKDIYRRYRDLSIFSMIAVYGLSIIDAYVDAELSSFDISKDLSMKVHPTIMNDSKRYVAGSGINGNSYGIGCSLNF